MRQGVLPDEDMDHEEEFEIDINEAEPEFLKGQSSRSGVEVPYLPHPALALFAMRPFGD